MFVNTNFNRNSYVCVARSNMSVVSLKRTATLPPSPISPASFENIKSKVSVITVLVQLQHCEVAIPLLGFHVRFSSRRGLTLTLTLAVVARGAAPHAG